MKIKVHRGTRQIGGSITEISSRGTSVFIDFGSELPCDGQSTDSLMVDMIRSRGDCAGVLFTHYHGDHVGLLSDIPDSVPLYMSSVARKILLNIRKTLMGVGGDDRLIKEYEILSDDKRITELRDGETVKIGDISVTPLAADHSAFDAFMFYIETPDGTVLHTGDFRAHGWLGHDKMRAVQRIERGVGVLIVEGTMMSRTGEHTLAEWELLSRAQKLLSEPRNKYAFLLCSSTNADSLASFCLAAHRLHRPFLVNDYVARQIDVFRKSGKSDHGVYHFPSCYTLTRGLNGKLSNGLTQEEHIRNSGFLMLIGQSEYYEQIADRFGDADPLLIYSMWHGYLDASRPSYSPRLAYLTQKYRTVELHTAGHADNKTICEFIRAVAPQKAIIPIHTEHGEMFGGLDIGALQKRIVYLSDGDEAEF